MASGRSSSEATFSILGADTVIRGDICATADLHIDGKVEGDITCATLVQGEASEILGGVRAESARLAGRVEGSVSARELVILKTARLHGDIRYDSLMIEQGAIVDGHLCPRDAQPREGDSPAPPEKRLILAASSDQA
ncbi:MAG: polymer-forming cytoskeletal protein [Novosphingobium sp.]|nr:polymer-forming cytoskeletal protein [Novosphingobium sp.]